MEALIFFAVLIFEVTFAIYCIVTKQNHKRIKSWLRIIGFILFVMLILGKVIEWRISWVLFAVLLFIVFLKGTVALINKANNDLPYKTSSIVLKLIITVFAFVIAFTPAFVFPQYKLPKVTGEYKVETATYTYIDPNRIEEFTDKGDNRFVNVEFWYPKNADGAYPLVVFSHGAFGIKASNSSTFTELASHGYVVVSIDHPYHSFYTVSEDERRVLINSDYLQEVRNANKEGIYTKEEFLRLGQKWMKLRTDDMNFVIDKILEQVPLNKNPIYKRIDTQKIGVFGHSMGGSASVSLGKKRNDVDAVVNIDAPFFSEILYKKDIDDFIAKDEIYSTPLLNIYSDDVWEQLDSKSPYVANKVTNKNFKEAYTVHFKGAKHLSLTDLALFSPILANVLQGGKANINKYYTIETQNELILEFLDYTLKDLDQFNPNRTY